jgi:hypothetical protein
MPEIIETTVYRLNELDETARARARDWYREHALDPDWYECVFEDFERICEILGVRLRTDAVPLMGGGTRRKPRIYFQGFWSQGDGACFEASYRYAKGACARVRAHAPEDEELHRIAGELQSIQRRNFYQLVADVTRRDRYRHEYSMSITVHRDSGSWQDVTAVAEEVVTDALRDLARWLHRQLEREYAYQTSDAVIDETIAANDYTFTQSGRRFG